MSAAPETVPRPSLAGRPVRLPDGTKGRIEAHWGDPQDPSCIVSRDDGRPAVILRAGALGVLDQPSDPAPSAPAPHGRRAPPPRRQHWTRAFGFGPLGQEALYTLRVGVDPADGRPVELFVTDDTRRDSQRNALLADAAIAISYALQHGVPISDLARATARDDRTTASPLGEALRLLAEEMP